MQNRKKQILNWHIFGSNELSKKGCSAQSGNFEKVQLLRSCLLYSFVLCIYLFYEKSDSNLLNSGNLLNGGVNANLVI